MSLSDKLPIGIQDFAKLRQGGYVYVDKTEIIYQMISQGCPYFLSRPRRFGKSLLISTLDYLFQGRRELFKGLWIETSDWSWSAHPVIRLDMSLMNTENAQLLSRSLIRALNHIAEQHGIQLEGDTPADYLSLLIQKLAYTEKVVVLVDEYDKPLLDKITDPSLCLQCRDILRSFYTVLKASDQFIAFLFLTGVTKFSKVSIFSGLNNLEDITLSAAQSTLLGYTKAELDSYFQTEISKLAEQNNKSYEAMCQEIQHWYNGYRFSEQCSSVYNPFSVLLLLKQQRFRPHWFDTGTPTFLLELMQACQFDPIQLESVETGLDSFSTLELEHIQLLPLLYQAGYLTMRSFDASVNSYTLGYPNYEVRYAFHSHLLRFLISSTESSTFVFRLARALQDKEFTEFTEIVRQLLSLMPYDLYLKKEKHYHSLLFLILTMVGLQVSAEVATSHGRTDLVIELASDIYIIELKLDQTAKKAIQQIIDKQYAKKFASTGKNVYLMGINFSSKERNITDIIVKSQPG